MKKILLLLVLVLSFNISAEAQNLLTNGGFEIWATGKPTGWTISNTANLAQNLSAFNEGTSSCKVNATLADFNIYQYVAVTPGKVYTFKLSYYIERGDGTDARINCYFRDASLKALPMPLEDSLALKGPGGNNAYFPNVLGAWKTYSYDVVAPAGASTFAFYLRTGTNGTVSWDNCNFAVNTLPTVSISKTSMTGFTYAPGNGPSPEQSLTVRGVNLTSNITITAPVDYEISAQSGASFVGTNSITIANTSGIIGSTPIYVRLKAGLTLGNYNTNLTVAATGTPTQNVSLTGSVAIPPVVINSSVTALAGFIYAQTAGPSAQKTFTISGTGLTSGIVVTAPSNYEISIVSGVGFTSPSFTLTPTNGTLATTTIYIRLKNELVQGSYNGNLTITSTGGTTKTISLTGSVTPTPGLNVSLASISGFSYGLDAGPSPEQSFTVSGASLTTPIIITTPTAFEVSTGTGVSFLGTNYLVLPQTGVLTTLYVRLMAGYPVNTYTGNISLISGVFAKSISVDGVVLTISGVENISNTNTKIYSTGNEIIIEGAAINEMVSIYNLVGMQLKSVVSKGDRISISVTKGSVYLVRAGSKIVKVIM